MNPTQESQETVTVGLKSYDAMWAAFAAERDTERQPPGTMTNTQYRRQFGRSYGEAMRELEKLPSKLMNLKIGRQTRTVRVYFPPGHPEAPKDTPSPL
jgi:hypothetical protein